MSRRVLIARQDNLGDVLLAGPAVRAVAASGAHVTMLCGPRGAAAAELLPGDRVKLDSRACQLCVGGLVALVADDLPGAQRDDVVAIVPLVALGFELVSAGGDDLEIGDAQLAAHLVEEGPL